MTGTLPFPRGGRPAPAPGDLIVTTQQLADLTAECPTAVVGSAVGLIRVWRYTLGHDTRYDVGCVCGLAPKQAADLCRQLGVHAADLPEA